ncbi:hypothetical protein [Histidinibacterium aquaticum]|uniref:Uncharacterized protein n=1 Tax=Histidinibacterium aquaticum TaxID=2613962 RepID=A0A5J5GIZ8_9RHOB|nr:hypothetical protein [Histidinibacterium aquaticum]KAA9008097.1 hypothetical protein F3S47_11360 [Histidinibacterium aquaticum]
MVEIVEPRSKYTETSFESFSVRAKAFGAKAAGLMYIPEPWRPNFIVLPAELHEMWRQDGRIDSGAVGAVLSWLETNLIDQYIVRSSGRFETIEDRGKYRSETIPRRGDGEALVAAVKEIFESTRRIDPSEVMALIVQEYVTPSKKGHFSNERRVSPTRNQWMYEVEQPFAPAAGTNCKVAPMPDPAEAFRVKGSPHQTFRSIGRWCVETFEPRCHIEWAQSDDRLWLLQLDLEWPQLDKGDDPTSELTVDEQSLPDPASASMLIPYKIGAPTRWKKLKNLSEFDFESRELAPTIFQLHSETVEKASLDDSVRMKLVEEIGLVTGGRAVVRTEDQSSNASPFNQPRTDTVAPACSVQWVFETYAKLIAGGSSKKDLVFLIHAFIPSKASA